MAREDIDWVGKATAIAEKIVNGRQFTMSEVKSLAKEFLVQTRPPLREDDEYVAELLSIHGLKEAMNQMRRRHYDPTCHIELSHDRAPILELWDQLQRRQKKSL